MSDLGKLNDQIERMRSEVKGTVDINYERYNTEIMQKAEQYNRLKKQSIKTANNDNVGRAVAEGAQYLHKKAKGRTYHY